MYNFAFTPNSNLKRGCQNPDGDYFSPIMYSDFEHESSKPDALAPHYIEKYPSTFKYQCHENITTLFLYPRIAQTIASFTGINFTGHPFKLREDGNILYREPDGVCAVIDVKNTLVCVDAITGFTPDHKDFDNNAEELAIFLCSLKPTGVSKKITETTYFI